MNLICGAAPGPRCRGYTGRLADPGRVYITKIFNIVDQTIDQTVCRRFTVSYSKESRHHASDGLASTPGPPTIKSHTLE